MKKYIIKRYNSLYNCMQFVDSSLICYTENPNNAFVFDSIKSAERHCIEDGEKPVLLKGQLAAYNKKK